MLGEGCAMLPEQSPQQRLHTGLAPLWVGEGKEHHPQQPLGGKRNIPWVNSIAKPGSLHPGSPGLYPTQMGFGILRIIHYHCIF